MDSVRSIITSAIDEVMNEADARDDELSSRKLTNRIVKRLAENKACIAVWVAELGVLKFVGYVNKRKPTSVRSVPYARDSAPVYMTQESD